MARGPKKHLKRMAAPSAWQLDKLTGVFAPKPSAGPHKQRECLPLVVLLRNRLKYALNLNEAKMILQGRKVFVDAKPRMDHTYPAGLMDVVSLPETGENFRLLYNAKGKFCLHRISGEEAGYKLLRVKAVVKGKGAGVHCVTHDGRTVRYPHPDVAVGDSLRFDLQEQSISKENPHLKFEVGNLCLVTSGNNMGRTGVLQHKEKHAGSHDIAHMKDAAGHAFCTRAGNVMVIGKGSERWVTLPKGDGVRLNNVEDRKKRMANNSKA